MMTSENIDMRFLLDQTDIIEVSDSKLKYVNRAYCKISSKMYDYTCDVKLVVGNATFKAHRNVLSDASDYFGAMFTHEMRERDDDVIELHDVSPKGFSSMMEYFYHGYVTVDPSNADGVVEVARFFHIEWLMQVSRHYLACHLAFEDYAAALNLADQYVFGDARSAIMSFIGNSFTQLIGKSRFFKLQFEALNDLLSNDYFIAASEGTVLQAVKSWLDHDSANREQYRVSLLKLIRLPLLETEDIAFLESAEPEAVKNEELAKAIADAYEYHQVPSRCCLMRTSPQTSTARGSQTFVVTFSGVDDDSVAEYRLVAQHRDEPAEVIREEMVSSFLDSVFEFAAVAVLGDCLFVAGGYSREMLSTPLLYCYSPHRRCWTELSSMQSSRVSHSLVAAEGLGLYAVAGVDHFFDDSISIDRDKILNTVEFYEPRENLWQEMPLLPFGAFNVGATFADNRLYVTGGITDDPENNVPVGFVNYCRPSDDGWTMLASMNHERHSHAVVAVNGKMYVFGGLAAGDDTMGFVSCAYNEMYDIETDQWTDLSPVTSPIGFDRFYQYSAVLSNRIFVLGSRTNEGHFLCEFDAESSQLKACHSCGTCVHKLVILETAFPKSSLKSFVLAGI